jgi:UDP-2,4-diacetamido-2,4,6-trideoxy-beta-L-altropyranose hydrolase
MSQRTAVFRADAGPAIGSGHVTRCLALAAELKSRGWDCRLAVNAGAAEHVRRLGGSAYEVVEVASETWNSVEALRSSMKRPCDLMIADHYGLGTEFETAARSWTRALLVIDDLANRPHDCDMLLDQNAGRSREHYAHLIPERTRALMGPAFALLRPEFGTAREHSFARRRDGRPIQRVLIAMGSTDPKNATELVLAALDRAQFEGAVDVMLSSAAPHRAAVKKVMSTLSLTVRLHLDAPNVADLMAAADIAVCAPGVTALECCCLGLPVLCLVTADNQARGADALGAAQTAIPLGRIEDADADGLAATFRALDSVDLAGMSKAGAVLCDGSGAARVADVATQMCGTAITLRPADWSDASRLLAWRNDESSRRASRSTAIVTEAEHQAWLKATLIDPKCHLRIAEWHGRPIGTVRSDLGQESAELSWTVDPEVRGLGLSAIMLRQALADAPSKVTAQVRKDNVASQSVATRAGLALLSESDEWMVFGR